MVKPGARKWGKATASATQRPTSATAKPETHATAARITAAARLVLIERGHVEFSMRNVATKAGVRLATLQYHFPTRDALVRGLMVDTERRYLDAYEQCLAAAPSSRIERFKAVLNFNLRDVADPATRRFIVQMWALLDTVGGNSPDLPNEFYARDLASLCERIAEFDMSASTTVIRRRASLIAALIEGLLLVRGAHSADDNELRHLADEARSLGLKIAAGEY